MRRRGRGLSDREENNDDAEAAHSTAHFRVRDRRHKPRRHLVQSRAGRPLLTTRVPRPWHGRMPPLPDDSHASCAAVCDGRVVVRLFIPVTAGAEDVPSQIEIGGQASVSDLGYGHPMPGFGGWLDVNVSRHVALETRLTWSADCQWDRTLHLAGGFRATFMRTPRFAWNPTARDSSIDRCRSLPKHRFPVAGRETTTFLLFFKHLHAAV